MKKAVSMLGVVAGLLVAGVQAQDAGTEAGSEEGVLKRAAKVDKPIADTYEPLNSTYVGDGERLNESIEQSWQLKKQAREREQAAASGSPERAELEKRIQEPGELRSGPDEPEVTSTDNSIRIREPQ